MYDTIEIATPEAFQALERQWNDLHATSENAMPFLRHEWLTNWWRHFGGGHRLAVFAVRSGERLVAALPLQEVRRHFGPMPFTVLSSMTNDHSFRFALLASPGDAGAIDALWWALRRRSRHWDLLLLQELAEGEVETTALIDHAESDGYPYGIWKSYASPYLHLEGRWDAFYEGLRPKFRSNMRNRMKRIEKEGPVRFETLRDGEVTGDILSLCFDIERRGWKGEEGSAIACDPRLLDFYTEWAWSAARNGWLRVSLLRVGEAVAAFDLSLAVGKRYYCMKIGYDPAFARYSVGQILNARILQSCFAQGVTDYEFLGPMTEAKSDWQPRTRRHVWQFVYDRRPVGRAAHFAKFVVREGLKRMVNR